MNIQTHVVLETFGGYEVMFMANPSL